MKRNPNLIGWDGPTYIAGKHVPCHGCDATGVIEDGERIDVDAYLDCLCDNCDGSGVEPWRAAGSRDTSNRSRDGLSFPRRGRWSETQSRARSLRPSPEFRRYVLAEIEVDVARCIPLPSPETVAWFNKQRNAA